MSTGYDIIENLIDTIPVELFDKATKANRRLIVKCILDEYHKYITNTLVNREKFSLKRVGSLITSTYKVGAKTNPFTGLPIKAGIKTRVRFKPFLKLKHLLNKEE